MTSAKDHNGLAGALRIVALSFVVLGVTLPWAIDTPFFALYRDALEGALGVVDPRTRTLALGITGGSIAGKWVAHLSLVDAVARGERWALRASLAGLVSWALVDSAVSLAHGAWWNVVYVNVVPVLAFGAPLVWAGRRTDLTPSAAVRVPADAEPAARVAAWLLAVCALGATSGLVIAFGGTTPLFAPWREALHASHPHAERADALFATFFGPIGGSTFAQFVMLAALARHRVARGDRTAVNWSLASFVAWLATDSCWSLGSGGAFNVGLVNAPFAALCLPVLGWARWRLARRVA